MTCRAFAIRLAVAVVMTFGTAATLVAAGASEPEADTTAIPLGPALESFPITSAESYGAFPVEILSRMRAALVARAPQPASPVAEPNEDD